MRDVRGGGGNVGEVIGFRAPPIARNLFRLLFLPPQPCKASILFVTPPRPGGGGDLISSTTGFPGKPIRGKNPPPQEKEIFFTGRRRQHPGTREGVSEEDGAETRLLSPEQHKRSLATTWPDYDREETFSNISPSPFASAGGRRRTCDETNHTTFFFFPFHNTQHTALCAYCHYNGRGKRHSWMPQARGTEIHHKYVKRIAPFEML